MIEILGILSVWAVTSALVEYDGPGDIFKIIRRHTGAMCFFCVSFWVSLAVTLYLSPDLFVLHWLGFAGGSALLYEVVQ